MKTRRPPVPLPKTVPFNSASLPNFQFAALPFISLHASSRPIISLHFSSHPFISFFSVKFLHFLQLLCITIISLRYLHVLSCPLSVPSFPFMSHNSSQPLHFASPACRASPTLLGMMLAGLTLLAHNRPLQHRVAGLHMCQLFLRQGGLQEQQQ